MDANLVPSCKHFLLKVGAALTIVDVVPTLLPFRVVTLKQEDPSDANQVYPGGQFGDKAVQK